MISIKDNIFTLHTANTTYAFRIIQTGHLEHMYYGRKLAQMDAASLGYKKVSAPGNTCAFEEELQIALEDLRLEMSSYGKGDIRDPFLEITHENGSFTSDFRFKKSEIIKGKEEFETLPGSYGTEDEVEQLCVTLEDVNYGLELELHYYVYPEYDVITRSAKLVNVGTETHTIDRLLSLQLDLDGCDYTVTSFHGNWAREMGKYTVDVNAGKFVNSSYTGTSSSRSNPYFIISKKDITERTGDCLGINLIYSGNHYSCVEADSHEHTRVMTGINPQSFGWRLNPGESFEAPEAVMCYKSAGYESLSQAMADFIRDHIIRGEWQYKERPILLNSWEAAYFDINEEKLLKLAKAGADAGIELFVMDDGWFGQRDDDHSSLGDWDVDTRKLPGGIKSLADKVNALGMQFGLWVEPEMICVKSKLYEAHPDWDMSVPGKPHVEARWQRLLDLSNPEVVDYIIEKMTQVFSSGNVAYVKWDMNRNMSDVYSQYLPADRQKETAHRYVLGFYRMAKTLNERFPHILFEGCSSGGNRFDLGMLCYFPQIWASDDTDALMRLSIQNGYSYGYPTSAPTSHVSASPNHQTHRRMPLATRFNVAVMGNLGYEVNLCDMKPGELAQIKYQVEFYKKYRKYMQYGDFYRDTSDYGNVTQWTIVSKDKKYAFVSVIQRTITPNYNPLIVKVPGLDPEATYKIKSEPEFYDILDLDDSNRESMKQIEEQALVIEDVGEEYTMTGEALTNGGMLLGSVIGETPWCAPVGYFPDMASKLYVVEMI